MAINKKLISFATQAQFDANLANLDKRSIVFIEDKKRIWTHGVFFDTSWDFVTGKPDTYTPSAHTLESHSDVTLTALANGDILRYNGSKWVNNTLAQAGIATSADITAAINNIEIGGRNLFKPFNDGYVANNQHWQLRVEGGVVYWKQLTSANANQPLDIHSYDTYSRDYTFSYKTNAPVALIRTMLHHKVQLNPQSTIEDKGDYRYVILKFTAELTSNYINWYGTNPSDPIEEFAFWDFMFERGNTASDWTPAPEDQVSDWNVADVTSFSYIKNKPTQLSQFTDNIGVASHIANKANPHNVTKSQVGLSNVDNTSDLLKPISNAAQSALNGKLDLTGGTLSGEQKYLSGNSFTGILDIVNTSVGIPGEEIGPHISFGGIRGASAAGYFSVYGAIGAINTAPSGLSGGALVFLTKNANGGAQTPTEQMRIATGGNVGIGTTNPLYKLDVSGTGRFTDTVTAPRFNSGGTTSQYIRGDGSLATYSVTTYAAMSAAEASTGTATAARTISAKVLADEINRRGDLLRYLPLSGGTLTGALTAPKIFINRAGNVASGISWYKSTYTAWQDYVAFPGSTGNGVNANITAPSGTLVKGWAKRSFIEVNAGYGWTFESGTNSSTTPSIVAEIRASDGAAKFGGSVTAPTFVGALSGNASSATNLSRSILAGNGLTGGGVLNDDRTLTLGTPSNITATSTNSVTTDSHTHSLTMGSGSGLDADLLDGKHASDFEFYKKLELYNTNTGFLKIKFDWGSTGNDMFSITIRLYQGYHHTDIKISAYNYATSYWYLPKAEILSSSWYSSLDISFGYDGLNQLFIVVPKSNYTQVAISDYVGKYRTAFFSNIAMEYYATLAEIPGTIQSTISAYGNLKNNQNAVSATKLQTPRTIWGQSFDGTENITGHATFSGLTCADIVFPEASNSVTSLTVSRGLTQFRNGTNTVLSFSGMDTIFRGAIYTTAGYKTSDITLKTNINDLLYQDLLDIDNIHLSSFNWIKSNNKDYGVIAQEIEKYRPELVSETNGKKTVNYESFYALKIARLEQRIKELENKLWQN